MFLRRILSTVFLGIPFALLMSVNIQAGQEAGELEPLRFGRVSVEDPTVTLGKYQPLLAKLGQALGRKVELVQTSAYADVQDLFTSGRAHFGVLNAYSYVLIGQESKLTPMVKRMIGLEGFYRGYIIAHRELEVKTLRDLKGKSFAFSEINSTSGYLLPQILLRKSGLVPDRDFSKVYSIIQHDSIILAVANKTADAGAVASYVFDEYDRRITDKMHIVEKSEPIPLGPIVARHDLGPELIGRIRSFFLHLHETEEGRAVLKEAGFASFAPAEDRDYDVIRQAAARLAAEEVSK
ncbi:MAG: phosphate/phosphite/phosphonate ABC transporter substrate-binding protein [Thermodesulfobacteriota bacterium]